MYSLLVDGIYNFPHTRETADKKEDIHGDANVNNVFQYDSVGVRCNADVSKVFIVSILQAKSNTGPPQ